MIDLLFNSEKERIDNFKELLTNECFSMASDRKIDWDNLTDWLVKNGFFIAPASTKYHGCYAGGLYDHCKTVFERLKKLTIDNHLKWEAIESSFIIGMFHDLCKIDQYTPIYDNEYSSNEKGQLVVMPVINGYEYNKDTLLKGHGSKSVMLLSQFMTLTEEEMLCIRYHMGAYIQDEQAEFDMAIKKYEGVLWTHQADMLASKIDGV